MYFIFFINLKMINIQLIERYLLFLLALESMSFGIAFTIHANLGVTSISAAPYVLSLGLSPTVGQFNMMLHTLLVIIQIYLLKDKFQKIQLLQIIIGIIFGCLIDINNYFILKKINPKNYIIRIVLVILGSLFLAIGITIQVFIKTINSAAEGFLITIVNVFDLPIGKTKFIFDITLCIIAVISSLFLLGEIKGVREGTVISSFFIGFFVGYLKPRMGDYIINFLYRNFPERKGEENFNDNFCINDTSNDNLKEMINQ